MRTLRFRQPALRSETAVVPSRNAVRKPGRPRCTGHTPARQAAPAALPRVWAVGRPVLRTRPACRRPRVEPPPPPPERNVEHFRPYTEAMLRRYVQLSMEAGRAPSLLGREMFRGRVTHCRVEAFDDVVIFCHDVERAIKTLSAVDALLLRRIGRQEYTQGEAAAMLGLSLRTVVRGYGLALDRLTRHMLEVGLLRDANVENLVKGVREAVLPEVVHSRANILSQNVA